jgi:hypothetical protein
MIKLAKIKNDLYINNSLISNPVYDEYELMSQGAYLSYIAVPGMPNLLHRLFVEDGEIIYVNNQGLLHNEDDYSTRILWINKEPNDPHTYFKSWNENGVHHKLDGPAIINPDSKYWYYEGKYIASSQEEFDRKINLKSFW